MVIFGQARRRRAGMVRGARVAPAGVLEGERAGRVRVRQILSARQPQAKLTVGPPGDAYEREADQVANAVMRMSDTAVRERRVQRTCAECEEEMAQRQVAEGPDSAPEISRPHAAQIQRAIASKISGVTMEKASTVKDASLKSVVTDQLSAVISSTMDGVALDAIYVSSANDGTHDENSRHYVDLAVDMSRVKTAGATDWQTMSEHYPGTENVKKVVEALQDGFEDQVGTPGIRENFGPYIKKKNGEDWTVGGHGDHIHISCNE